MRALVVVGVALAVLGFGERAQAQATGFAVNRFEPSERGSEWFVMEALDLRGNGRFAGGIVVDWAYRPLAIYESDGSVRASIVRNQVFVHPGGAVVFFDRLRLGVSLPVQVHADGHTGVRDGVTYLPPTNDAAVGDLRLGADLRLFGTYGEAVTGAIGLQAFLPTGDTGSYTGDGSVRLAPRALLAGDVGPLAYAAKLGVQYRAREEQFASSPIGSELFYGLSAGLRAVEKKLLIGPELFGGTVVTGDSVFGKRTTPLEGMLGAHLSLGPWRIGAGIGAGLTRGYGSPTTRGLGSIEWAPGIEAPPPSDRDKDGIVDTADACPDTAGIKTDDPKTNGCPPPPDRDRDGILDRDDACPNTPGISTEDPKTNGCPDRDKDGVVDSIDACPDTPGIAANNPATNGCPPDRDGDGVLDEDDACPDVPGLKTSDPETNGCPDPDRDKDGIPNEQDACPDEPGKPDPDPKRNGCPKAFVQGGVIKILDQVKFKTASAEILPGKDSEEVLQAVLKVLNDHLEIKKLRIEGHTDDRGPAPLNKKLSADRAASVVKWLKTHGIDVARLTSEGFGPDRPLGTNATDEGRANNRRVEFHIEPAN